jgi:hypothetical protein
MSAVVWCGSGSRSGCRGRACGLSSVVIALLLVSLMVPAPARAQANVGTELKVIGANALLGGVTAGVTALVNGRPFFRAFGLGAAGGVVVYGGKRFMSWHGIPGSGLAGRFFGAAGASMARNGAAGRGAFDLMLLPVGPFTLYLQPSRDSAHARLKVNLVRAAYLTALVLRDDFRLDVPASVHAATPVFERPGKPLLERNDRVTLGFAICGTVIVGDPWSRPLVHATPHGELLAHERVHVVQGDFLEIAWAGPIEHWLLGALPGGAWLRRYVEPGILAPALAIAGLAALPGDAGPWEKEADYFETAWDVGR